MTTKTTISAADRRRLAELIQDAATFGHTHNDFNLHTAALAVIVLYRDYGIRLGSLQRANETIIELDKKAAQRNTIKQGSLT